MDSMEFLAKAYEDSLSDNRIRDRYPLEDKPELKPCPFCGREAYLDRLFISTSDNMDEMNGVEVGCRVCGIRFRDLWEYHSIVERWNTRVG